MDATVTKFTGLLKRSLGDLSKILVLGLTFNLGAAASARTFGSSNTDLIYVQAPSLSSYPPYISQPVIPPPDIPDGEWDKVGHLWPRMVSYSMETDAVEGFIDTDLKVGMQYNYSFQFEMNARNGQGQGIKIPEGWYQLQIVVIKKRTSGAIERDSAIGLSRYVTSNSMFLKVSNGSFGRTISLRFPDLTMTSLKHHLFVELIPLQEECEHNNQKVPCFNFNTRGEPDPRNSIIEPRPGYKTYLVEMPFTPFVPSGGKIRDIDDIRSANTNFVGGSLANYIARAQARNNRNKRDKTQGRTALFVRTSPTATPIPASKPEQHAKKNNLDLVSLNDPSLAAAAADIRVLLQSRSFGLLTITEANKPIFATLCAQLVAHQAEFQTRHSRIPFRNQREMLLQNHLRWCAADPQKYMRLSRVVHAGKLVSGKIKRIAQKSLSYTLMANYMSSRSQSTDSIGTVTIKPPRILLQLADQIGVSVGHSVNFVNGRAKAETGIASMSNSLDFNYVIFNIPTIGSQQCLEVRALPDTYAYFYNRTPGANTGVYICDDQNQNVVNTPEIYAHAFERCRDTTMMECDSLTQSVNARLRGELEISAFLYAIRDGITPDHNNRVIPFGDMNKAEQYFANAPVTDDLEVVTPIEFPRETVPSFWRLISMQHREF